MLILQSVERTQVSIFLGVLGLLTLFNLVTQVLWSNVSEEASPFVICFHLATDVMALAVLLEISGSIRSPLVPLIFLQAALGGLLIPGRLSPPFLMLIHSATFLVQCFQAAGEGFALSPTDWVWIVTVHVFIFAFWAVMRFLGLHLERARQAQLGMKLALERRDHLRAIGALSAGFSHEFASPLNSARIILDRMRRLNSTEGVADALDALEECSQVLRQMNSAQMDPRDHKAEVVDLNDLTAHIIQSWLMDRNQSLVVRIESEPAQKIVLPVLAFAKVLINVLDNASEAGALEIIVALEQTDEKVILRVRDNGQGFRVETLQNLGEPFLTTKAEGVGLGLYSAGLFAQSLGGALTAGNLSVGAQLSLEWPREKEGGD